jgi:LacI family transcriptional regulator
MMRKRGALQEKITIKHIAKAAGVSVSTVSRALRRDPRANERTTQRIIEIANELKYYPDFYAKSMRQKRTKTIGVILNDLTNPFATEILAEIGEVLNKKDYSMFICYSNWDFERERKNVLSLLSKRVDGVIIAPVHEESENIQLLSDNGVEVVIIDCYPFFKDKSYVYTDHGKGAIIATEYLIRNGHRSILLFTGPLHGSLEQNFVNGYMETLKKHGLEGNEDFIIRCEGFSIQSGYETFKRLITESSQGPGVDFTAVVAICDLFAVGIYRVANELRFDIPGNYSIVGYDNIAVTTALSPPLTTIHQPRKEIGTESAEILLNNIENESEKERKIVTFEPFIVVRGSVRKLN